MVDIRTRPPRNFVHFVGQLVSSFNHQESPKVCGARHHGQFHPESLPGHAGVGGWVVGDILSCHIFLCLKMWYTYQNKGKWLLTSGVGGIPFSDKPTCCHMCLPIFLVDEWVSACILTNWRSWFLVKSAKPMKDEQRFYGYFSIRDEDTSPKIRHNTAHGKFAFRFGTCVSLSSPDLAKWQATSWHIDTLW